MSLPQHYVKVQFRFIVGPSLEKTGFYDYSRRGFVSGTETFTNINDIQWKSN